VVEEGIISEVKEKEEEVEEAPEDITPEEEETKKEREMYDETTKVKKTIESVVKETFFSEMETLKKENEELKAQIEKLSKVAKDEETDVELSDIKPIAFNPENENKSEVLQYGSKRPKSTMDTILEKLNN